MNCDGEGFVSGFQGALGQPVDPAQNQYIDIRNWTGKFRNSFRYQVSGLQAKA